MKFEQRLLGLLVFSLLLAGLGYTLYRLQQVETAQKARTTRAAPIARVSPAASGWHYARIADAAHGSTRPLACVRSANGAAPSAQLCVRGSVQNGVDVYVQLLSAGAIACSRNGCSIRAQFGGTAPRPVPAIGAADGSTGIVFVSRKAAHAFVSSLKQADSTFVEVGFDKSGTRWIGFDTAGLVWN